MKKNIATFCVLILSFIIGHAQEMRALNNYYLDPASANASINNIVAGINTLLDSKSAFANATIPSHIALDPASQINAVTTFGLVGDGSTDNTTTLQKALDASYAQSKSLFFPAGVYLTGPVKVNHCINISGEGTNSIIRLKSNNPDKMALMSIDIGKKRLDRDVVIQSIGFDGNIEGNGANKQNNLLQIYNSQGVYLNKVLFRGAVGKNLDLYKDSLVFVSSSTFDTSGLSSVACNASNGIYFVQNTLTGWGTQSLKIYPAYACNVPSSNQFIYGNHFINSTHAAEFCIEFYHAGTDDSSLIAQNVFEHSEAEDGPAQAGGIGISGVFSNSIIYKNKFLSNDVHNGLRAGLELTCINTVVIGNELTNGNILINANRLFRNVNNNLIANNKVRYSNGVGASFLIYSDSDVQDTVRNLTIWGNELDYSGNRSGNNLGIRFGQNSTFVIRNISVGNNKITGNGAGSGIFFESGHNWNAENISIQSNTINGCATGVQNHNDNTVQKNFTLKKNSFSGVSKTYDINDGKVD